MEYGKEIVLNRMYNGDYLNDNLGHEVINMYKDDNGKHYIYLQPLGTFANEHSHKVGAILLVRTIPGKKKLEIIGKADDIEDVYQNGQKRKEQLKYIHENNIKYGGVSLEDIFDKNNKQQDIFITYKAAKVVRPKKAIFISFNNEENNEIILKENNQAKASLKQYIGTETPKDYQKLFELINNANIWEDTIEQVKYKEIKNDDINFFKICRIENNELAFSNALAYFMEKHPELITDFAKEILNVEYKPADDFEIIREKENNIDLLLKDKNQIIVIENKIKSEVNGHIKSNQSEEMEYSQLHKYYEYTEKIKGNRKSTYILLTPNYNDINLDKYKSGNKYKKIYYRQIYGFLNSQHIDDIYLKDFIKAIEKHTKDYDNELYEEMKQTFYNNIINKKNSHIWQQQKTAKQQ